MTKAKISEYDAVASNNTDVNGVNIAEGCPPSGMNNMGREIMAALKRFQVGSDGDGVTVGGNLVVSGSSTVNTFTAGPVSATTLNTSGAVVFNDAGADVDFRVEGDTDANLLFVDASADAVGVGTNSAGGKLTVQSDGSSINALRIEDSRAFSASPASSVVFRQKYNTAGNFAAEAYIAGGKENATDGNQLGYLAFGTNNNSTVVERMRIDSSGNVGIGRTPSYRLDMNSSTGVAFRVIETTTGNTGRFQAGVDSGLAFIEAESGAGSMGLGFKISNSEKMRIDSSGNLLVGTTVVNSATGISLRGDGVIVAKGVYNTIVSVSTRDIYMDSDGYFGYISSTRDSKTNIADIENVSWLYALTPVSFNYKKFDRETKTRIDEAEVENQYGLIAEDVEAINPDICFYDQTENGQDLRGVSYTKLITPMLKAIQELKAELDTVKAELATLKG